MEGERKPNTNKVLKNFFIPKHGMKYGEIVFNHETIYARSSERKAEKYSLKLWLHQGHKGSSVALLLSSCDLRVLVYVGDALRQKPETGNKSNTCVLKINPSSKLLSQNRCYQ